MSNSPAAAATAGPAGFYSASGLQFNTAAGAKLTLSGAETGEQVPEATAPGCALWTFPPAIGHNLPQWVNR